MQPRILYIWIILFSYGRFAQAQSPQIPIPGTFQQITTTQSYSTQNSNYNSFQTSSNNYPTGASAQNIINQTNRSSMQVMGYTPQPTQEEMKADYYNTLATARQKKTQDFFNELNTFNNSARPVDPKVLEELAKTKKRLRTADTSSVDFINHLKYYNNAYNEIVSMLSGKSSLNLKRAVFVVENAYHKNKLSYEKYCRQIDGLTFICRQIMHENGVNEKNYMACHYAIQKLFSEKVIYKNAEEKTETFEPFGYDFVDVFADNDQTKGFVTKLLNTKIGQCHSMPLLYLIIANELNANAYMALAPNHSYVKFGNQYQQYGFETTNGTFTTDEWIVASGYISPAAIKNKIYLAPLTKDKVIAECLVDLEEGLDFLFGKSSFSIKCANTTLKYFPNSIGAILTINNVINAKCAQTAKEYQFPKEEEYAKFPRLKKQFDELIAFELKVEQTGYLKISKDQYENWQQTANEEKQKREHLKLLSKLKESANGK